MSDAISKIAIFLIIVIVAGGMIFSSVYNAIQVSLLQTELSSVNKAWQNSNQSTYSALQTSEFINQEYSKRFYDVLTLIKEPNTESKCLNTKLSNKMKEELKIPPKNINIDDNYKILKGDIDD